MASRFPSLKLTYFDVAGRAEPVRLALFIGQVPFQDERLTAEQFARRKASLVYGQLPVLEVDGEEMAQSEALLRYAGRLAGLYPHDPIAALRVNELLATMGELSDKVGASFMERDPIKQEVLRHALAERELPHYLQVVNARLATLQQQPAFQSDQIWIHELHIYATVSSIRNGNYVYVSKDLPDQYPAVAALHAKVHAHPRVQEWNAMHIPRAPLPQLKLTYFDTPGRAEPIRLALTIGGIPFEDERIERSAIEALRPSLPFGQVPVLQIDGVVFSQSWQLLIYVGILAGLYPKNADSLQALRIDELLCLLDGFYSVIVDARDTPLPPAEKEQAQRLAVEQTLPKLFAQLNRRIAKWGGPYAAGDALSIADLAVYGVVANFKKAHISFLPPDMSDAYENVTRVCDQVRQHDKVKDVAWLAQY